MTSRILVKYIDIVTSRRAQKRKHGKGLPLRSVVREAVRSVDSGTRRVYLDALGKYRRPSADDRRLIVQLVDGARALGATWREVGDALGVSAQAAQQRFGSRLGATERSEGARATERSEGGR